MQEDIAQQIRVILNMFKHSLFFRHTISHPSSDQNNSFQLSFWDINKIVGKYYVNSSGAIQAICTFPQQSYHYCNIVCKMKLTGDIVI